MSKDKDVIVENCSGHAKAFLCCVLTKIKKFKIWGFLKKGKTTILISACLFSIVLNIYFLLNFIAVSNNGSFWGAIFGAIIGGTATLIAFKLTADQTKRQFDVMIAKERPRLTIEDIKPQDVSEEYKDIILNVSQGKIELASKQEFIISYNNLGQSTADTTMVELEGYVIWDAKKKVLGRSLNYFGYLDHGNKKNIRAQVYYNPEIFFSIDVRLNGKYLDKDLPKSQKIIVYDSKEWMVFL